MISVEIELHRGLVDICFVDLFTLLLIDYVISDPFGNYIMNLQTPVSESEWKSEILNDLYRQEAYGNNFV